MDLTFTSGSSRSATSCASGWPRTSPDAAPADGGEDAHYAWRRDWQRKLYDAGWAAPAGRRSTAAAARR